MKRAALFLLLLTAGFFALRMFDTGGLPGKRSPEPDPVTPVQETGTPSDVEPVSEPTTTDPPDPSTGGADDSQGQFTPEGNFSYLKYYPTEAESDPRWIRLRSEDSGRSATDSAVIELRDFEGELFDVESQDNDVRMELTGTTARVRELSGGPISDPEFAKQFEIDGVHATILDGAPIVPLTLESPTATVDLAEGQEGIESDATVVLRGDGLELDGTGYRIDLAEETLRLLEQAKLRLTFEGNPTTELRSTETLIVSRDDRRLVARATGGASIGVPGTDGGQLQAKRITMIGRGNGENYRLERLEAEEAIVWELGTQRFQGERLTIRFTDKNEPKEATLEGSPVAELELENRVVGQAPEEPAPVVRMTVRGEKTLRVIFDDTRTEFRAVGPAIVETADGTLRSIGDVLAWEDDTEAAGFRALTGVVLESADGEELLADELEGLFDPDGGDRLLFRGEGNVSLDRRIDEDTRIILSSSDGLDVTREGERWKLVEGNDITIVREDATDSLFARADHVYDAELEGPTFTADGNVIVRNSDGELTGSLLRFDGMRSFSLEGREEEGQLVPARLVGALGTVTGRKLERRDDTILATDSVTGDLVGELVGGRLELDAESFALTQESSANERRWIVHAEDKVIANWTSADGTEDTQLDCDVLDGLRIETFAPLKPGEDLAFEDRTLLGSTNEWVAEGVRNSQLTRPEGSAQFQSNRLVISANEVPGDPEPVRKEYVEALGEVVFQVAGFDDSGRPFDFAGQGHQLYLTELRAGRLRPLTGGTVQMSGGLREDQVPFSLESTDIVFDSNRMDAANPVIELEDFELTGVRAPNSNSQSMVMRARSLVATPEYLDLIDNVRAEGRLENGAPWDFSCSRIRFELHPERKGVEFDNVSTMRAAGNVRFRLGSSEDDLLGRPVATASGARLICSAGLRTLRLEGNPAEIVTPAFRTTSTSYLEFDPEIAMLIGSGPGEMMPGTEAEDATWSLRYHSSRTFIDQGDNAYITAMLEPILTDTANDSRMRASWMVLWLDRDVWAEMPERMRGRLQSEGDEVPIDGEVPATSSMADSRFMGPMLGFLTNLGAGDLVKEVYFEGPVEAEYLNAQVARAGAIYLDVITGRGWLHDVKLNVYGWMYGAEESERLVVRAKWMRHGEDGSLRAKRATVTPCSHEESHLRVVTGDLRISPQPNDLYEVALRDNRIELFGLPPIPLPKISYGSKDAYTPLWKTISFGNSARFGTSVSAGASVPNVLGGDPDKFRSNFSADLSYLGSRGVLLDLGLSGEWKDRAWFNMELGGLPDGGRDRGYIRVPKADRDNLRLWYRLKSRLKFDETSWLEARLSTETDAGVQSEFFEGDFQRYEQNENFLHLRSAQGPWYFDLSAKKRLDGHRAAIEELPSAGVYRGLEPILTIGGLDVNHTGSLRAEYLRRREGTLGLQSPYALPATFADGFGNREVARVLTEQRVEIPFRGPFGMRLVPFLEFDFRGWDEDTTGEQAHRGTLTAGGRLSSSFYRRGSKTLAQFGPYVEYGRQVDSWREGDPFVFDRRDLEFDGDALTVGAYARVAGLDERTAIELDLSATHLDERTGAPDAWLPGQVFARLEVEPFGVPFELWHDATYDVEDESTRYSLSSVAIRPNEDLRFEVGHRRARANDGTRLFEAMVFAGIWRANEKWEFEGRHTLSLRSSETLDTTAILRRFGHDIVFEIDSSFREGEGSSIGISVEPRFGWKESTLGYVRY